MNARRKSRDSLFSRIDSTEGPAPHPHVARPSFEGEADSSDTEYVSDRPRAHAPEASPAAAEEDYSLPPPTDNSLPIPVAFRVTLLNIAEVKTKEQTGVLRCGFVFYWNDRRLAGWTSASLPASLWGPEMNLQHTRGPVAVEYEQFALIHAPTGRLKRIINYEATVGCPMDLRSFPFDYQTWVVDFITISHWRLLDERHHGSLPSGQSYRLFPVLHEKEGALLHVFFHGRIDEWYWLRWTVSTEEHRNIAGFVASNVKLTFVLQRRFFFYVYKVVVPLSFMSTACFLVHVLPIDAVEARLNSIFTLFIAAVMMIYVIADALPRVDHLLKSDISIFMTLSILIWLGIESWGVHSLSSLLHSPESARHVDLVFGVSLLLFNLTFNFYLWGQPYVRTCQAIASLRKDSCELYTDGRLRKMTTHLPRDKKDLRGHHMKVNKPTIVRRTSLAGGADHVRHEPTIPEDAPGEVGAVEGEGAHAGPPNILAHLRCFRDPGAAMRRTWAKVRKRPADAAAAGLL